MTACQIYAEWNIWMPCILGNSLGDAKGYIVHAIGKSLTFPSCAT